MASYNSSVEIATKQAVRGQLAGGASARLESINNAVIGQYSGTVQGETWPEYTAGNSYPTWVDDAIAHSSGNTTATGNQIPVGARLQCRQVLTQPTQTQVRPFPSAYGNTPPQTSQYDFRKWWS